MQSNAGSPSETSGREGKERSYFRSPRTVFINNFWYFLSRERGPEGPFRTREEAEEAVERYIQLVTSRLFDDSQIDRINTLEL